uniref:Uncharacterized protein n=1 Tax=Panagrolaimus sp. PS1159 TaxID=55785 RepID=A0AC35FNZ0_9BILA
MSQGKVQVEFKKANGGIIEVSEEKLAQSKKWFEKINKEVQLHTGLPDATHELDKLHEEENIFDQTFKEDEMPERGSSLSPPISPIYERTNDFPEEPPKTPMVIIKNTATFKPFTPPTISNKLRQEMIAQRNNDRKRKADDDIFVPSTSIPPPPHPLSTTTSTITPEQLERSRRNREAAIAKRRSLQNL